MKLYHRNYSSQNVCLSTEVQGTAVGSSSTYYLIAGLLRHCRVLRVMLTVCQRQYVSIQRQRRRRHV